jgi:TAG lipase / steryl ester hydrolase / phospholipase A2 / LPA acyltransferase
VFPFSPLADAERAMAAATTYAEWLAAAAATDDRAGAAAWRAEDQSEFYDAALLRSDLTELRTLREAGDARGLIRALTASVYRHQADVGAPELYGEALGGTKLLIESWLDEADASLRWLAANPIPGFSAADKLQRFEQAFTVYGRTALMLSGGATWGFHHLGVVKALFEADCLPYILSGASTGAMVAGGICSRTDAEIADLFANPEQMRLDGLLPVGARRALKAGAWLDPDRLLAVLRHNVGDLTLGEAYAHSGRALNISVSPTRTRQKPRVLSHLTAPEVLVANAALASSALPGLFPPVVLEARGPDGIYPYVPRERWVDGSLYGDLPKLRLARLHNVNHFIVSQANPHVAVLGGFNSRRGVAPAVAGAAVSAARTQGTAAAAFARRATPASAGPLQQIMDRSYALMSQDYGGDIVIHPRFRPELLRNLVVNPTPQTLRMFILEGERATWPTIARVRDQTRLGRTFRTCIAQLKSDRAMG